MVEGAAKALRTAVACCASSAAIRGDGWGYPCSPKTRRKVLAKKLASVSATRVERPSFSRKRAPLFSGLLSPYVIENRCGRPEKGNDKGSVEGIVGWSRGNFMVPLPHFATWDEFNARLEEQCRKQQADVLRGHSETPGERLQRDLEAIMPLPPAPFESCDQTTGRVSSQALVRCKRSSVKRRSSGRFQRRTTIRCRSPTVTATSGSGAMSTGRLLVAAGTSLPAIPAATTAKTWSLIPSATCRC